MPRTTYSEISEHDQLVLMMAQYFQQIGYTNIRADITGWLKPDYVYWTNDPNRTFYPDITCNDQNGVFVILEAETCNTLSDQHTHDQFKIFRAHATNNNGRFEVVVPRICNGADGRTTMREIAAGWGITINNIWAPSN